MLATQKINNSLDQWLDIHYGDTSFNGRVFVGHRAKDGTFGTKGIRPLKTIRGFVRSLDFDESSDYYITANTVKGIKRRKSELFGLQNIVIDVDCHDDRTHQAINDLIDGFIWRCESDLWSEGVIPTPNSIVRTGRGVQLWWALLPCYGGQNYGISLYHHNKIKRIFVGHVTRLIEEYTEELEGLNLDPGPSSNPVGYFRLPGTYNTKAQCYVSLEVLHGERYDQRELTKLEAPENIETPEIRATENASTKYVPLLETDRRVIANYESTGVRRVIQLMKLRNLRNNAVGKESRDKFNFSVYNALRMTYDHEEAMERLRDFNAGFKEPMTEKELENCLWAAKARGGYKYTNEGLIELLEVTSKEQQAIGLYAGRGYTRRKPNASRDEARKTLKEDRDNKILALIKKGVSQAETARILGIGKNTVWRVVKRLKETIETIIPMPKIEENSRHQNGSIFGYCVDRATVPSPVIASGGEGVFVMRLLKEGG